ncbi:MAG: hypothetical protein CMH54_09530 [Myxococcales bacterium]|nr:hypothetical protein [Myxococcales bacterium]
MSRSLMEGRACKGAFMRPSFMRFLFLCGGLVWACSSSPPVGSTDLVATDVVVDDSSESDVSVETNDTGGDDSTPSDGGDVAEDTNSEDVSTSDVAEDLGSDLSSDAGSDVATEPEVVDDTPKKVLFLGNSYTAGNNLVGWVADLAIAAEYGPGLTTKGITYGGYMLQDHQHTPSTIETIQTGEWTHVVLQEQSTIPLIALGTMQFAASSLSFTIKQTGAVPVFFETWARREGNPLYETDLAGHTPESMQEALRNAYTLVTNANGGVYAPVGDAWEISLATHPDIPLHSGDGSHAAPAGTYLAACVFFSLLTGQSPVGIELWPESLTEQEAFALQTVAHETVQAQE